jgi:imidazolonepropionase-like amidohydrolase
MKCVSLSCVLSSCLGASCAGLMLAIGLASPISARTAREPATQGGLEAAAIAIVHARVVDGTGQAPFEGTVVVRNGRIVEVGAQVQPPAGARVIDGQGKTLLPGFFDLHTHLLARASNPLTPDVAKQLASYLYCGVTSVVEMGSDPESYEPFRQLLSSGALRGPHVSFAARFAVPGGHGAEAGRADLHTFQVVTPREAHVAMRQALAYRPDLIKVFADGWRYGTEQNLASMEPETLAAITQDARAAQVPVFTHTVTAEGARNAAKFGVNVQAHGIGDKDADATLARAFRDRDMTYVSTLAVYEPREHRVNTPLLWDVIEPAMRERLERPERPRAESATSGGDGDMVLRARQTRWTHLLQNVKTMQAAGVRVSVGTDAGMPSAPHGWSTLLEMRLLVEAGMTPLEVLTAATRHAAEALHVEGDRGTIAAGKRADLVLVDGDPTRDIAELERVSSVFFDGVEVDRPALKTLMTSTSLAPMKPALISDALIDDFETPDGRSRLGALWMNATDAGAHPTRMVYGRTLRAAGNHALQMFARMSDSEHPYARAWLALARGDLQPADVSQFTGVQFEARGEGTYRLTLPTRGVRDGRYYQTTFSGAPAWAAVTVPFATLAQTGNGPRVPWSGTDVLEIGFDIDREPESVGWLEIDNLRLYR